MMRPKPWEADLPQSKSRHNVDEIITRFRDRMNDATLKDQREFPYRASISFDEAVVRHHVVTFGSDNLSTLVSEATNWCYANCHSRWRVIDHEVSDNHGIKFVFKFASDRDAILFKFWQEGE